MPLIIAPLLKDECRTCIGLGEFGDGSTCDACNGSGKKQPAKAATEVNSARDERDVPRPRRGGRRPAF
jgi:DnaJ-class molecular chaperone